MRRSCLLKIRANSGIASGGRNTKTDPRIPLMDPPHTVDITKYVALFQSFHTVPHVWRQKTLANAWAALYREMGKVNAGQLADHKATTDASANGAASSSSQNALAPSERVTRDMIDRQIQFLKTYDVEGLSRLSSNLEISRILLLLPDHIREAISRNAQFKLGQLEEIFLHIGMPIEVRGDGWAFTVDVTRTETRTVEVEVEVDSSPPASEGLTSAASSSPALADDALLTNEEKELSEVLGDEEQGMTNQLAEDDRASSENQQQQAVKKTTRIETKTITTTHIHHLLAHRQDIAHIEARIAPFGPDGRSTLPGTLHRVSAYKGKDGRENIGFTIRVGKYIANAGRALTNVIQNGNLLILSRPSVGKTTLLRDLAVQASLLPSHPRVVVIDTSCEIGGDNVTPLPFMNRVRRIMVKERRLQSAAMLDALQNHSPDYIIVDEIANEAEANAAYTISQRGVRIIATCHAETLQTLTRNRELNGLVGGVAQAFLSNEERRLRNKTKKSILERPMPSPFTFVLELPSRASGVLYTDVNLAIDHILDDGSVKDLNRVRFPIRLDDDLPPAIDRVVSGVNESNTSPAKATAGNSNMSGGRNSRANDYGDDSDYSDEQQLSKRPAPNAGNEDDDDDGFAPDMDNEDDDVISVRSVPSSRPPRLSQLNQRQGNNNNNKRFQGGKGGNANQHSILPDNFQLNRFTTGRRQQ